MGRGATKAAGNVWYEARIEAAKWNDRLNSREGAAGVLGISADVVNTVERGLHKCIEDVRPMRLREMSAAAVKAEGAETLEAFAGIWDGIIAADKKETLGWAANPWVFAYEFKRISKEEATGLER